MSFKVGDWVVILKSSSNWNSNMDRFVGRCVQITSYNHAYGGNIEFDGGRDWFWFYKNGHFRAATQKEINIELGLENYDDNNEIFNMNKIKKVLEGIYNNLELRRTIVPLFISNPGMGKTQLIYEFAKEKGVNIVEFITSQRNPFEISGMPIPDKEIKKMSIWDFDTLLEMNNGDILFFDELLNGNPVTLNACLTLLEQRKTISGKKLPDLLIVAAANPQGMTPLTPQIKERFVWYNTKFSANMWQNFMFNKYKMPTEISSKLCELIKKEDFTANNFDTPRSLDKATNMIINEVHTPYYSVIGPILNTLIQNKTGGIVKLSEDKYLAPNENIPWLELIKLKMKNGVTKK